MKNLDELGEPRIEIQAGSKWIHSIQFPLAS